MVTAELMLTWCYLVSFLMWTVLLLLQQKEHQPCSFYRLLSYSNSYYSFTKNKVKNRTRLSETIYQGASFIASVLLTNQFLRVGLPLVAFKTA